MLPFGGSGIRKHGAGAMKLVRNGAWWGAVIRRLEDEPLAAVSADLDVPVDELERGLVVADAGGSATDAPWWPEVVRAVVAGGSLRSLARRFDTNPRRIRRGLARAGLRVGGVDVRQEGVPALRAFIDRLGAEPDGDIAALAGVPVEAVQGERRRRGIAAFRPAPAVRPVRVEPPPPAPAPARPSRRRGWKNSAAAPAPTVIRRSTSRRAAAPSPAVAESPSTRPTPVAQPSAMGALPTLQPRPVEPPAASSGRRRRRLVRPERPTEPEPSEPSSVARRPSASLHGEVRQVQLPSAAEAPAALPAGPAAAAPVEAPDASPAAPPDPAPVGSAVEALAAALMVAPAPAPVAPAATRPSRRGWRVKIDGAEQPFLLVADDVGQAMELLRRRVGAQALARASVYRVGPLL